MNTNFHLHRFNRMLALGSALLGLYATSAMPAAAQSISSAYKVAGPTDTLVAPFGSSTGVTTPDIFSGPIEIQVTGTGHAFYSDTSDAFYFTATQTECVAGFPGSPNNGMFELAVGTPQHPFPYTSDPSSVAIKYDIAFINGVGPVAPGTIPAYSSTNTYDFVINVPSSTATALTFGVDDNNFGDNGGEYNLKVIQLAAIPEPSTWALLLGGAGLLAALCRRRARAVSGALAVMLLVSGMASAQAATPIPLTASQFSGTSASFSGDAIGGNPPPYGYTNNTSDNGWIWNPGDYFTVNFNTSTDVTEFRVWSVYTGGTRGATWEAFGSNDGVHFAGVDAFTYAISNGGGVNADGSARTDTAGWYEFDLNAGNASYQYWRIEDIATTNNHSPRSAQVEFYGNAVPEPATWATVLGGAGLLVVGQRLRRSRAA